MPRLKEGGRRETRVSNRYLNYLMKVGVASGDEFMP